MDLVPFPGETRFGRRHVSPSAPTTRRMDPRWFCYEMLPLLGGILIGGCAVAATRILRRGRAERTPPSRELDRLVRGRQAVLDLLAREGALDFSTVRAHLRPSPRPERLADWLVSMVADGSLHAVLDPDGRAAFATTSPRGEERRPRICVDLAQAEAYRP